MNINAFFESTLNAGAILSGFCGTFLSFRIQREANYYRQPAVSYDMKRGKDVPIGLTHFSPAFLILCLATLSTLIFGVILPLLALKDNPWARSHSTLVVAGLMASIALIMGYFASELVHYKIISTRPRLINDIHEWKREVPILIGTAITAIILALIGCYC